MILLLVHPYEQNLIPLEGALQSLREDYCVVDIYSLGRGRVETRIFGRGGKQETVLSLPGQLPIRPIEVKSVWSRGITTGGETKWWTDQNFCKYEWKYYVEYICSLLNDALWMNHPYEIVRSQNRVTQQLIASSLGISTPSTLVANSMESALSFFDECEGRVVAKKISPGSYSESTDRMLLTQNLKKSDILKNGKSFECCPVLLQEKMRSNRELRITVVNGDIYSASLNIPDGYANADNRILLGGIPYGRHSISDDFSEKISILVKELGLKYAAIDVMDCDGEMFFLEANPCGQWGYIEMCTGYPITQKIAEVLGCGRTCIDKKN